MVDAKQIQELSDAIANEFHPEKIILFGSHAYGTVREHSDVDILVIMRHDDEDIRKAIEIRQKLRPNFALDLLVHRPDNLQWRLDNEDWFLREITEKGKILYEAAHA